MGKCPHRLVPLSLVPHTFQLSGDQKGSKAVSLGKERTSPKRGTCCFGSRHCLMPAACCWAHLLPAALSQNFRKAVPHTGRANGRSQLCTGLIYRDLRTTLSDQACIWSSCSHWDLHGPQYRHLKTINCFPLYFAKSTKL